RILTGTITSPTLAAQMEALLAHYPQAQWHQYEAINPDNAFEGSRMAFGRACETLYRFDRARRVLAIDADFLSDGPGAVRYAHDFSTLRRNPLAMSRIYAVEALPTLVGSSADHRLALRPDDATRLLYALARLLGVAAPPTSNGEPLDRWAQLIARDLQSHRG